MEPSVAADVGGLLLVHAHPDDEAFGTGGLIARSVAEGRRVDLVTCTGGEEGEIHDPSSIDEEAKPRLREIRHAELQCALDALRGDGPGTLELHLLGYRDSGMMGTESNAHPDAFWNADLDEATGRLVAIVRRTRPAVMVSYDSNGNYGHPDHINAYRIADGAWEAAADPERYPEAGPPHAVGKLYEIAFNRDRWMALMNDMKERGIELPWGADEDESESAAETDEEWGIPPDQLNDRRWTSPPSPTRSAPAWTATRPSGRTWAGCWTCRPTSQARAISPEFYVLRKWRDREVPEGYRETSVFD